MSARRQSKPNSDRVGRTLLALERTASTSRVLNLLAIQAESGQHPDHGVAPMFQNKVLNSALILKHRVRSDDLFMFEDVKPTATKVIIPFERSDLGLGGKSLFIGQKGWVELLRGACNDHSGMVRDLTTLRLIDMLPSLDPFVLREHLRRNGMIVAPCYFALSPADLEQMQRFVGDQIGRLIQVAYGDSSAKNAQHVDRLVRALLSTEVDDRLEPLRQTLKLEGASFREGVFSWKGFLYYKWTVATLWPQLDTVIAEILGLSVTGARDDETQAYLDSAPKRVQKAVAKDRQAIARALKVYDDAFNDMIQNSRPQAFREFLLRAPEMFAALGEKVGVVSHIASFWRYRFPLGARPTTHVEDAIDIFQDFETGLGISATS
ncbi:MAG: hypothetical protein JWP92_3434 [Caulobacter sp.]|nr:hypothetical protein [Caulobacter sp.]